MLVEAYLLFDEVTDNWKQVSYEMKLRIANYKINVSAPETWGEVKEIQ